MNEDQSNARFRDAVWAKDPRNYTVVIGGAGGIGSWTTLFLSRIGYNIFLYDHDDFDETNMSGQFVNHTGIGRSKVGIVRELCQQFGGRSTINTYNKKYEKGAWVGKYMIAAFDNMKARKDMFSNWLSNAQDHKYTDKDTLFIDGRLDLERVQILCVTPSTAEVYREKYLFGDDEVANVECTLKQTSHIAAIMGGMITSALTNHISNQQGKLAINAFYYEHYFPLGMITQIFPEDALAEFNSEKEKVTDEQHI